MFDAPARRLLAARLQAEEVGDWNLVAECDLQLARWGVTPPTTETALPVPMARRRRTRSGQPVETP